MRSLIEHCRMVSPGIDWPEASLTFHDGVIETASATVPCGPFDRVIDGRGKLAVPGFIDIHSHGRSNADFCDGTPEAIATIGRGKLQDGVTGFLATTLTVSTDDLRRVCRTAREYADHNRDGATLLGMHLEGPFINPHCVGAQNPEYVRLPEIALVDELNALCPVRKVTFSPELPGGLELTRQLAARGIMPSAGDLQADFACFVQHREAGRHHLTHFCNVMTPVHHLHFGMVGGGLISPNVYVEMICDGVHLCDEMIALIATCKGPSRMMLITDSMRAAAMPDGDYSLGGLPVVVRNGKAQLRTGQVAGSTLRYHNGLKRLLKCTGLPLCEAIRATSLNQAESLHLGKRGRLEPGWIADIALLDQNLDPCMTICSGQIRWP